MIYSRGWELGVREKSKALQGNNKLSYDKLQKWFRKEHFSVFRRKDLSINVSPRLFACSLPAIPRLVLA